MLTREWATLPEFAAMALPGVPETRALQKRAISGNWSRPEWRNVYWRRPSGTCGTIEYSYQLLDRPAQLAWMQRHVVISVEDEIAAFGDDKRYADEWRMFHEASQTKQKKALEILQHLDRLHRLMEAGYTLEIAIYDVCREFGLKRTTVMNWRRRVKYVCRHHWLPFLLPGNKGATGPRAACDEHAWEFYRSDYLRAERPNHSDCYRRMVAAAEKNGWVVPSAKTMQRRINELPTAVIKMAREGRDRVKDMVPAQERDRTHMHALQAVNADGHKWDVFVKWPDGTVARPMMVAWQDLYSNMFLSWRVDRSENTDAIQLALGDLVEKWGIPQRAYLDNGRAFASKRMTGGAKTRFRFKIREGDAAGVMTILGIETIFVTPYSGQSKPIERGFRDFAQGLSKHPAFAGAYTGNNPMAKPENYGSSAVPLETFLAVISDGIKEHNSRMGRNTAVCGGVKSFRQVFEESLAQVQPRKPVAQQRHLWLRAAENLTTNKKDGSFKFLGNRYFGSFLNDHLGESIVVRFDPQDLHQDMHVYSMDGRYLGDAPIIEKTGFDTTAAAAEKKRAEKMLTKATKMRLDAEKALSPEELVALMPDLDEDGEDLVESKVVQQFRPRAVVAGSSALALDYDEEQELAREREEMAEVMQLRDYL
ncbi:phage transposase [Gluconobacter frateurii M-2]|nr:phage transposase [Gluconobacter frateurii M-2]